MPRKKPQNNFLNWGQNHCENWIWNVQIFFHRVRYLMLFWGQCSTRPHNFIHIFPPACFDWNCDPIANPPSAVNRIQLDPSYQFISLKCSTLSANLTSFCQHWFVSKKRTKMTELRGFLYFRRPCSIILACNWLLAVKLAHVWITFII